jgi:uncharacterized protein YbcI
MGVRWGRTSQERATLGTHGGSPGGGDLAGGRRNAAISNAAVRIHREYLRRGPQHARTTIAGDLVVVMLHDALTRAERRLVDDGRTADVIRVRQTLQDTMRGDLVAAVEELIGRTVLAAMTATHIDPDLTCQILVLAPASTDRDGAGASTQRGGARDD